MDPILCDAQRGNKPLVITEDHGLVLFHRLIYVPESLRTNIIQAHHDNLTRGHFGTEKTAKQILHNYYFPNMH